MKQHGGGQTMPFRQRDVRLPCLRFALLAHTSALLPFLTSRDALLSYQAMLHSLSPLFFVSFSLVCAFLVSHKTDQSMHAQSAITQRCCHTSETECVHLEYSNWSMKMCTLRNDVSKCLFHSIALRFIFVMMSLRYGNDKKETIKKADLEKQT